MKDEYLLKIDSGSWTHDRFNHGMLPFTYKKEVDKHGYIFVSQFE